MLPLSSVASIISTQRGSGTACALSAAIAVKELNKAYPSSAPPSRGGGFAAEKGAAARAAPRLWSMAGVGPAQIQFAELHDCFTIAELLEYEAMGLTASGQGARAVLEGWTAKDGRLPRTIVNRPRPHMR